MHTVVCTTCSQTIGPAWEHGCVHVLTCRRTGLRCNETVVPSHVCVSDGVPTAQQYAVEYCVQCCVIEGGGVAVCEFALPSSQVDH